MFKRIGSIAIVTVMMFSLFLFTSCSRKEIVDRIAILVKTEYKNEFLSEEISLADFEWENAERIEYYEWYDAWGEEDAPEVGYMILFLKKHGKKQVYAAIEHCSKLDFVYEAYPYGYVYGLQRQRVQFIVLIKSAMLVNKI